MEYILFLAINMRSTQKVNCFLLLKLLNYLSFGAPRIINECRVFENDHARSKEA